VLLRVVVDVILSLSLSLSREKSSRVLCAARAQKKTISEGNASSAFWVVDKIGSHPSREKKTRETPKLKKKEFRKKGKTHTRHHKKKFVTTGG